MPGPIVLPVQPAGRMRPKAASVKWQEFFTDHRLQSVIDLALAHNRDLRMAALNIERAQALYRIQRAEQYPSVNASGAGQGYRLPAEMSSTGNAHTVGEYTAGWAPPPGSLTCSGASAA